MSDVNMSGFRPIPDSLPSPPENKQSPFHAGLSKQELAQRVSLRIAESETKNEYLWDTLITAVIWAVSYIFNGETYKDHQARAALKENSKGDDLKRAKHAWTIAPSTTKSKIALEYGRALLEAGKYAEAQEKFAQVDTDSSELLYMRARADMLAKKTQNAYEAFKKLATFGDDTLKAAGKQGCLHILNELKSKLRSSGQETLSLAELTDEEKEILANNLEVGSDDRELLLAFIKDAQSRGDNRLLKIFERRVLNFDANQSKLLFSAKKLGADTLFTLAEHAKKASFNNPSSRTPSYYYSLIAEIGTREQKIRAAQQLHKEDVDKPQRNRAFRILIGEGAVKEAYELLIKENSEKVDKITSNDFLKFRIERTGKQVKHLDSEVYRSSAKGLHELWVLEREIIGREEAGRAITPFEYNQLAEKFKEIGMSEKEKTYKEKKEKLCKVLDELNQLHRELEQLEKSFELSSFKEKARIYDQLAEVCEKNKMWGWRNQHRQNALRVRNEGIKAVERERFKEDSKETYENNRRAVSEAEQKLTQLDKDRFPDLDIYDEQQRQKFFTNDVHIDHLIQRIDLFRKLAQLHTELGNEALAKTYHNQANEMEAIRKERTSSPGQGTI